MRSKFKWIFTLLLAFTMQFSFAQEKTITGVVTDATGPLPGVNVVVKGTQRGTQTNFDGSYSIKAKEGETLLFTFMGMKDMSMQVGGSASINVRMSDEVATQLSEVVVQGYGKTATKPKAMTAATTVSAATFENRPNVTLLQSLQGAAPGLTVSTSSGSPGSAKIDLLIRGIGTLNSSTEPLYVVDGTPTNSVVFRNLNPEDIESASVLRDAIATSIYGNRGANGVIIINTKAGKFDSPLKMSFSSSTGFSSLPKDDYNLANSQQLMRIERAYGDGGGAGFNPFFGAGVPLTDAEIDSFATTDWRKEFFNLGVTQSQNLSLTVGGKNINNFTSIGYMNQDGIVPTTDFQRFTFRTNTDGKSENGKFKYGTNLTVAYSTRHQLDQETAAIDNNTVQNPLLGSLTGLPYYGYDDRVYPGSGQALYDMIGTNFTYGTTTFVMQDILKEGNVPNRVNDFKVLANADLTYNFTDAFSAGMTMGVDYNSAERTFARAPWAYLAIAVRETNAVPFGGLERQTYDRDFGYNTVAKVLYNKTFKEKHAVSAGLYTEYIKAHRRVGQLTQNGLDLKTYAFGAGTGWTNVGATYATLRPTVAASKADAGSFSYFGTLGYEYDGKYAVDAIVRRDASYRFVDDFKWGTFWSVGGRWNIDREKFMENSIFDMLKLRGSYGTQGNQNIQAAVAGGNPLYLGNNLVRDLTGSGTGYGNSGAYVVGQIGNTTLQWEEQAMSNIGLDFEIYHGRFSGNLDVYKRQTTKLFNNINLSASVGNGTSMDGNNGGIVNKGIELALKYKIIKNSKDFKLSVFANGSYNKNEITDIEKTIDGDRIYENGSLVGEFYTVPYAGVNPADGNLQFLDIDGNLTANPSDSDRRRTGKSDTPVYQGAFGLNADYKGFFLDTQFAFVQDVYRYDWGLLWLSRPSYIGGQNMSADLLNAWTPTNTDSNIPSLDATNFDAGSTYSDMWLKDASYIRLKNVSLGYNFSSQFLSGTFIKSLKLYAQGENLYTWTKWRGFDADSVDGNNLGKFPSPRTISVGVNVEF
ncbi:SusC/RagA family TonB-linked outer membrane protein [Flavobacterium humi]|uniref:SusC/RagA family TonB-linked outer membrane protein n=1 Tax=Flavobacterium humi TaxID=2562683 RepID=A0A4Z0L6Y7_9FLAO|nr:SusC/RagA family TonB-linked outer membrane protein [Flavobacterium humi]TGD56883.1 SusC/RagA family TonB-linked outer membrane protein [Flavobacterium humi]